jgi:hypothetical protein
VLTIDNSEESFSNELALKNSPESNCLQLIMHPEIDATTLPFWRVL